MPELDYTENLDGREISGRIDELVSIRDEYQEWKDWTPDEGETEEDRPDEPEEFDEAMADELKDLEAVANSTSIHSTFIHEDNWKDYAVSYMQEMHPRIIWSETPFSCIDWNEAVDEMRQSYNEVEIQGSTYIEIE